MTVTAECRSRWCINHAEVAQDYCSRCLSNYPHLAEPIEEPTRSR